MGCHLVNMWKITPLRIVVSFLPLFTMMHRINVGDLGAHLVCIDNLMQRLGMDSYYIYAGTRKLSVVNSGLMALSIVGLDNMVVFMLKLSSLYLNWVFIFTPLSFLVLFLTSCFLFQFPPSPRLWFIHCDHAERERQRGNPKHGLAYYSFLSRHTFPASNCASSP